MFSDAVHAFLVRLTFTVTQVVLSYKLKGLLIKQLAFEYRRPSVLMTSGVISLE